MASQSTDSGSALISDQVKMLWLAMQLSKTHWIQEMVHETELVHHLASHNVCGQHRICHNDDLQNKIKFHQDQH